MAKASSTSAPDKSVRYIELLLEKANDFCNGEFEKVSFLYRNQSRSYFEEVEHEGGIMKPRLKDMGGDSKSLINGRLEGVFFCVTLYNGKLPTISPYGDQRIIVPIEALFDESSNLYFADFYCFGANNHYIILVLIKAGTDADEYCKVKLPKLDPQENKFLYRGGTNEMYTNSTSRLWVEVLYNEDVDIGNLKSSGYNIHFDDGFGDGHSTPGGIQKDKNCKKCNLSQRALEELNNVLEEDEEESGEDEEFEESSESDRRGE